MFSRLTQLRTTTTTHLTAGLMTHTGETMTCPALSSFAVADEHSSKEYEGEGYCQNQYEGCNRSHCG